MQEGTAQSRTDCVPSPVWSFDAFLAPAMNLCEQMAEPPENIFRTNTTTATIRLRVSRSATSARRERSLRRTSSATIDSDEDARTTTIRLPPAPTSRAPTVPTGSRSVPAATTAADGGSATRSVVVPRDATATRATDAGDDRRYAAPAQVLTDPVAVQVPLYAVGLLALAGAASSEAADVQSFVLVGLSSCGEGLGLRQAAEAARQSVFPSLLLPLPPPFRYTGDGDDEEDLLTAGSLGSIAVSAVAMLLHASIVCLASLRHGRGGSASRAAITQDSHRRPAPGSGPSKWTLVMAKVRFPDLTFRFMTLILPGLAAGAIHTVSRSTKASSAPAPPVGAVVGSVAGLVLNATLVVAGLRVALANAALARVLDDEAPPATPASQAPIATAPPPRATPGGDVELVPVGNASVAAQPHSAAAVDRRVVSVMLRYDLAFASYPVLLRRFVLPPVRWATTATNYGSWGAAFSSARGARVVAVGSLLHARAFAVGLLLCGTFFELECTWRVLAVALLLAAGALAMAVVRPLRYRLMNATSAASQLCVAGGLIVATFPDAVPLEARRALAAVAVTPATIGAVVSVAYSLLDRFRWRPKEEEDRAGTGAAAAGAVRSAAAAPAVSHLQQPLLGSVPQTAQRAHPARPTRAQLQDQTVEPRRRSTDPVTTSSMSGSFHSHSSHGAAEGPAGGPPPAAVKNPLAREVSEKK